MLARLDMADVPVLSSTVRIQQSAHDLGVVNRLIGDCRCQSMLPERLLSTASTATSRPMLVRGCHQDDGPGFHYQSPGLVQLTVLLHH